VLILVGPKPVADTPTAGPVTIAQAMASQRSDVFSRVYALAVFNVNDCVEDTTLRNEDGSWAFRNTRFFPAYPGYDWGILLPQVPRGAAQLRWKVHETLNQIIMF
jgi:hypothetical protein